jgi:hypothetical protein
MVSYQCSPLSIPEGIVGTFSQRAKLQEKQDLTKFVSVVVMDEVGLAEDSPRMLLKVCMQSSVLGMCFSCMRNVNSCFHKRAICFLSIQILIFCMLKFPLDD